MQPLSGNQRPDLLTYLTRVSLVLRLPSKNIFADPLQMSPPATVFEMLQNPHVLRPFDKVHNPLRLPRKTTSERPKASVSFNFLHV